MVMKIVLVAAVVMALGHVTGQRCMTRDQRTEYRELVTMASCVKPKPSLVQLPVPEGFDYVTPSVVTLYQCTGLSCSAFPERCLPMPGQTQNRTYKVYASSRNGIKPVCAKARVQEHLACVCRCDERACPSNRVFNRETCECECNPHLETRCKNRRDVYGEEVMWSSKFCSCECDKFEQCDSTTVWDPNLCQCAPMF
ncbi:balbiani ring protein 3-like isoform X1 [Eriocheir sinensis]|uniref:balbiani ring protein 3-like isoform X1 n=1 Tax=Eriocheir sinensis TaxID=95602 RepID=UPI0021C79B9A|nr:balbiani ring protein 3-like isoform X1 [Eriocheir sinensis]